jgi:hypothetical protein
MNTISYKDLKQQYLNNETCREYAKKYFGNNQPNIFVTGFYSSNTWNWGYMIGIVGVGKTKTDWFEVVTQFGEVVSARPINLPILRSKS